MNPQNLAKNTFAFQRTGSFICTILSFLKNEESLDPAIFQTKIGSAAAWRPIFVYLQKKYKEAYSLNKWRTMASRHWQHDLSRHVTGGNWNLLLQKDFIRSKPDKSTLLDRLARRHWAGFPLKFHLHFDVSCTNSSHTISEINPSTIRLTMVLHPEMIHFLISDCTPPFDKVMLESLARKIGCTPSQEPLQWVCTFCQFSHWIPQKDRERFARIHGIINYVKGPLNHWYLHLHFLSTQPCLPCGARSQENQNRSLRGVGPPRIGMLPEWEP